MKHARNPETAPKSLVPEALPPEVEALVSSEFHETINKTIDAMTKWFETGNEADIPEYVSQDDGYSAVSEAERDELLRRIGETIGSDVDSLMTANEESWVDGGGRTIVVEPWVKHVFEMDDPDQEAEVLGIKREIVLIEDAQQSYNLHELEIPHQRIELDGTTQDSMKRIMYFTNYLEPTVQ